MISKRVHFRHLVLLHQSCPYSHDKNVGNSSDRHQDPSQRISSCKCCLPPANPSSVSRSHLQGLFPSELVTGESNAEGKSTLDGGLEGVPIPKSMGRPGQDEEMAAAILCMLSLFLDWELVSLRSQIWSLRNKLMLMELLC